MSVPMLNRYNQHVWRPGSQISRKCVWALRLSVPAIGALMVATINPPAKAVPAFTDQTGQPCQTCHVGGFGPQLTPFAASSTLSMAIPCAARPTFRSLWLCRVRSSTLLRTSLPNPISRRTTISPSIRQTCSWRAAWAIIWVVLRWSPMMAWHAMWPVTISGCVESSKTRRRRTMSTAASTGIHANPLIASAVCTRPGTAGSLPWS